MVPPVLKDATHNFHFEDGTSDLSRACILDHALLKNVRADMRDTFLPSWLQRPPGNFGMIAHGKLKADEWRTVATVSLLITLVRVWGSPSAQEREKKLLDNFVHLVVAVEQSTRRSITLGQAKMYDQHMHQYLVGLRTLFDHKLGQNHHMSLHLKDCIERFGPVHGWWSFPFERYNGVMGRLKKNNHGGKQAGYMPANACR